MTARLSELNTYMKKNLKVYKSECQAPMPVCEFFKVYSKGLSTFKQSIINAKLVSQYVTTFKQNTASVLNNSSIYEKEIETVTSSTDKENNKVTTLAIDWPYLQQYPANFNYTEPDSIKLSEMSNSESIINYGITFNWYKPLAVSDRNSTDDKLLSVIAFVSESFCQ